MILKLGRKVEVMCGAYRYRVTTKDQSAVRPPVSSGVSVHANCDKNYADDCIDPDRHSFGASATGG